MTSSAKFGCIHVSCVTAKLSVTLLMHSGISFTMGFCGVHNWHAKVNSVWVNSQSNSHLPGGSISNSSIDCVLIRFARSFCKNCTFWLTRDNIYNVTHCYCQTKRLAKPIRSSMQNGFSVCLQTKIELLIFCEWQRFTA